MQEKKAYLIFPGSGPLVILTSYESITNFSLIKKINSKGIEKFIAFELPMELVRQRYGDHFEVVMGDLNETDDLRVLDFDGPHAFGLFSFQEMGEPVFYERNE
jgi:hypothetical protein